MNSKMIDTASLDAAVQEFSIDARDFEARKRFLEFESADARLLAELQPMIAANADRIVDAFYANVESYPALMDIIANVGSNVDRLKKSQRDYLLALFSGTYDEAYMEKRLRIGVVHFEIGLGPRWYLGSYSVYFALLSELINARWRFNGAKRLRALQAVNKILSLDAQIAIDSYVLSLIGSIRATVSDVHDGITDQAAAAAEQAAAVAQTSTSLEEVRETSNQTMDKASEMAAAAERAQDEGSEGLRVVEAGVDAIGSIREQVEDIAANIVQLSERTRRIGEITQSVSNLAQQSKMLAINASIEAAKAGEAGKGFAVVAEEVGNLAEQSDEATTQVRQMLDDVQSATEKAVLATEEGTKKVDHGVGLIQSAGTTMASLQGVIETTTLASHQIVASIRQQNLGISQVTDAMSDINKVTTQFVTSSGQIKRSVEDLTAYVDRLKLSGK